MNLHAPMAKPPTRAPSDEPALPAGTDQEPGAELQRTFGRNFRKHRLAAGLTQDGVAKLTGMHRQGIAAIEAGTGNVTLKTMHRLAMAVHCRVEVLLMPI